MDNFSQAQTVSLLRDKPVNALVTLVVDRLETEVQPTKDVKMERKLPNTLSLKKHLELSDEVSKRGQRINKIFLIKQINIYFKKFIYFNIFC